MDPRQWERLKDAFSVVIAGGPTLARDAIAQVTSGDPHMAQALQLLVDQHFRVDTVARESHPEAPVPAELPQVLAQRFQVITRLGSGTFGDVYRARDTRAGAEVAVKVLRSRDAVALEYFKREFRILADVRHQNLLSLYDLVASGDQWMFSMELVDGVDFLSYLTRQPPASRQDALCSLLKQLVSGIHALHRERLLHRDLKPTNVLVTASGRLVILDFGLVRGLGDQPATTFAGTPDYMSPEQAAGAPASEASDWYAMGVMLYQALTGQLPFRGDFLEVLQRKQAEIPPSPSALVPDVFPALDALCTKLLERDPAARASFEDVTRALGVGESATRLRGVATLLGREDALSTLSAALETSAQHPVVVHVCGPSGIGKTALVGEFLRTIRRDSTIVFAGRCYEGQSIPYQALDDVVDQMAHFLRRVPPGQQRELLPRNLHVLAHMFPVLGQFVHGSAATPPASESAEFRIRGLAALRELVGRMAERYRVVIVIDDLQWGDADGATAINDLLSPIDAPPVLVLVAYRSEDATASTSIEVVRDGARESATRRDALIELDTLNEIDSERLASALSTRPLGAGVLAQIAAQSTGNPFLISEIVRWFSSEGPETEVAAFSVEQAVSSRVSGLSAEARRLVQLIAIAGQPTDIDVFRAIPETRNVIAARDELLGARVVRSRLVQGREELEIYHDRIRDALTATINADVRVDCHRTLARALVSSSGDPERIAMHFQEAHEPAQCSRYALEAANRALRVMAFNKAAELLELALSTSGPAAGVQRGIRRQLGDALSNAGRGAQAAEHYLSAAVDASARDRLTLQLRAAEEWLFSGHVDEGLALFDQLLTEVGLHLPRSVSRVPLPLLAKRLQLMLRGMRWRERDESTVALDVLLKVDTCSAVATGLALIDIARGAALQTTSLLLAMRAGEPARLARALAMEAGYRSTVGAKAKERAEQILDQARDLAARKEDPRALGLVSVMGAACSWSSGHWDECVQRSRAAKEILQGTYERVTWERDTAAIFEIDGLRWSGRWAEMKALLPELLIDARTRGDLYAEAILQMHAGSCVALADDDPERARTGLALLRRWSKRGFHVEHLVETHNQVEIALYEGRGREAFDVIAARWPALRQSLLLRVQTLRIQMHSVRARAAIAAACEAGADRRNLLDIARRDSGAIRGEKTGSAAATADLLDAGIAACMADPATTIQTLISAERTANEAGMLLHALVARRLRSVLKADGGSSADVQAADEALKAEGIVNAVPFSQLMAPGVTWRISGH